MVAMKSSALKRKTLCRSSPTVCASNTKDAKYAILFDCDGVIVETEELHRLAYNKSFQESCLHVAGKQVEWSVEYYDILANTVGGGKPKMRWHFTNTCSGEWPESLREGMFHSAPATEEEQIALIDYLQDCKTMFYKSIVEEVATARPGVLELMDEGLADPATAMAICSAATKAGFEKVVNSIVGPERLAKFDLIIAGDDVDKKKPDPMIYNIASHKLGMSPDKCVVIEDSLVGLKAAKGAKMNCIITYTASTDDVDFKGEGADEVLPNLEGQTLKVVLQKMFPTAEAFQK